MLSGFSLCGIYSFFSKEKKGPDLSAANLNASDEPTDVQDSFSNHSLLNGHLYNPSFHLSQRVDDIVCTIARLDELTMNVYFGVLFDEHPAFLVITYFADISHTRHCIDNRKWFFVKYHCLGNRPWSEIEKQQKRKWAFSYDYNWIFKGHMESRMHYNIAVLTFGVMLDFICVRVLAFWNDFLPLRSFQ